MASFACTEFKLDYSRIMNANALPFKCFFNDPTERKTSHHSFVRFISPFDAISKTNWNDKLELLNVCYVGWWPRNTRWCKRKRASGRGHSAGNLKTLFTWVQWNNCIENRFNGQMCVRFSWIEWSKRVDTITRTLLAFEIEIRWSEH